MSRFVYGIGPVRELVASRPRSIAVVYVAAGKAKKKGRGPADDIVRAARDRRVDVELVSRETIDKLVAERVNHQGVVAIAGEFAYADVGDMFELAERRHQRPLLIAADGVTDPHNLGAIMRSAYLLGAHGLLVPRNRAAGVTAAATKVSAGASEHLAVAQVTNLARTLAELKEREVWVAGAAGGPDAMAPWQLDGKLALCIVVGSEGSGMRKLVREQCDFVVGIPMAGAAVGSFNVSVAAAMLLYEVARQRGSVAGE